MKTMEKKLVRCAIYTRKSTEEGLSKEFNSLDAQREAAENFVKSQQGEGWVILPARYDDGGFSGGNMERPALRRLMKDIEQGLIDVILVYKVDRLSRSLLDFASLIGTFDQCNVSFVSVTQNFTTTSSMGRLTLNILLSFAQFEREIIGERIRDKIAAAKRKGKQTGGTPVLGYDLQNSKLVVNPAEAKTVCNIYRRFLVFGSTLQLARELNEDGVLTKAWTTRRGRVRSGSAWNKCSLYKLLTNRKYIGEVTHYDKVYPGEHEAIVERKLWEEVQAVFRQNGRSRANASRSRMPALLKGILRCGHCGGTMGITYTKKNGRIYRYYQCLSASKNGYDTCPVKTVPAGEIETAVTAQLREMLRSPEVLAKADLAAREDERTLDTREFAAALQDVDAVWEHLFPAEQARICRLLLESVTVSETGMRMQLRNCGVHLLAVEVGAQSKAS